MKKPKMLYASPFQPMKSGISDYSEVLAAALGKVFDVTLLTADYEVSSKYLKEHFPVLKYGKDMVDFAEFDYRVYNMGNNPEYHDFIYEVCLAHPGMVILHDVVLYYLFVGYYQKRNQLYAKVYEQEGIEAFLTLKRAVKRKGADLLAQKEMAPVLPLHKELFRSGNRLMVHSWYAYHQVLNAGIVKERDLVKINPLPYGYSGTVCKPELFQKYHIPQDAYIIASMGYIEQTKLNHIACKVVRRLNEAFNRKVCYVMVGEGNYADCYIDGNTVMKTGYTQLDEFDAFIKYADIILNLRNPSMGETSGAMLRILEQGKVCVINDGGWFSEIPESCVIKVCLENVEDDLYESIRELMEHPQEGKRIGECAAEYIRSEYREERIVGEIKRFLEN
ncbi:MAG: glycosyltransferase [Eubacterium sp.]|nr:glycosyltransferase [Eubacterium sp.]